MKKSHIIKQIAVSLPMLLIAMSSMPLAEAGTRSYNSVKAKPAASHTSTIRIQAPGESPVSRSIVLPYNKSTVIEMPTTAMDVIISNQDIVEAVAHTANRTVLIGRRPGQTNAYFYSHDGRELLNLEIRVERDVSGLGDMITRHTPGADVEVRAVNDNILLTGSVANAAEAAQVEALAGLWLDEVTESGTDGEIVNLLSIKGKDQVLLKVRIVEMARSVTKQLGIDLNAVGRIGDTSIGLASAAAVEAASGFSGDFDFVNSAGGNLDSLSASLQAFERVGLIRTLAEPTLTAISGETANFLSGGEIPFVTGSSLDENGNITQEIEFRSFGIGLGFTPVVLSEGRISLNISTEVSEPTTEGSFETGTGTDILGFRVRRLNSVVELPAGGSMVLGGLIREESRQSTSGTPGVKDVPGLGALFRNRDDLNTQQELVIIVTPYLVDPTHPDKLQTPLDGFKAASDGDYLLLGRLNDVYGKKADKIEAGNLAGPFGHVVD